MNDYSHLPPNEQIIRLQDDIKIYELAFDQIKNLPPSILDPDGRESGVTVAQLIISDCEEILNNRFS